MDDNRHFLYSLFVGGAISGLVFWLAFWHGRVLMGIASGAVLVALYWIRFNGTKQWHQVHRRGSRREIRRYEITVTVLVAFVVGLCIFLVERAE